jgi:hypothetical protein
MNEWGAARAEHPEWHHDITLRNAPTIEPAWNRWGWSKWTFIESAIFTILEGSLPGWEASTELQFSDAGDFLSSNTESRHDPDVRKEFQPKRSDW